jgi:hypothetical protein
MVEKPTEFVKYILRYYTPNLDSNYFDTHCIQIYITNGGVDVT